MLTHAPMTTCPRRTMLLVAALVAALTGTSAVAANAALIGPDVSSNNHSSGGIVNWGAVRGVGGASFAFVKATEGGRYLNPNFAADFSSTHAHGLIRGAFHYARPNGATNTAIAADATAEANLFFRATGTLRTAGALPPVLDIEVAGTLNPAQLSRWTHTWLDRAKRLTGRTPIVYTFGYFWKQNMGNSAGFAAYPLWLASYSRTSPAMVGGWKRYTFWQYTDRARVAGVNRPVDMSVFNGTATQLRALANLAPAGATARVALKITAALSSSYVKSGTVTYLRGATSRSVAGRTIYRQRYYLGTWRNWATTKASAAGTYSFAIRATTPVNYYRTMVKPNAHAWLVSPTRTLRTHR